MIKINYKDLQKKKEILYNMNQPRLKAKYFNDIVPLLKKEFKYKSVMQVPRLKKICINQGIAQIASDKKKMATALAEITQISGQKAVPTKAKKSISNFKLREGMVIGIKVTLRNERMYEFLDRFINIALPRVRDFRGLKNNFDSSGNYTLGIKEQIIFPEVNIDQVNKLMGMNITFVTNTSIKEKSYNLLKNFGFPFN